MPSVEQRKVRDGVRYVVRVRDPDPLPGKSGYTSATFATKPEAERFVRDVDDRGVAWALADYRRSKDDADALTLDQWAAIHFDALTEPSAGTVRRYKRIYAETWKPHLGHLRLTDISRVHVATALNLVDGSDKTRKNKWAVLTHMLKLAAQDGHIPRTPTHGVKLGIRTSHETEEHRYLTHAEFWAVVDAAPEHWRPLVILLGGSGMRWGELAALTVGDLDVDNLAVRITKAEKQDPENPSRTIVGPPKTRKARRTVTLPAEVVDALEPLVTGRKKSERLFLPPMGGPLRHRTFYRDIWLRKALPGSGIVLPYPRLHDIRHSHVAWLIAQGVPLPVIQARLGHEKITTTVDVYGHLLPDLQRAAADAAGRVFDSRPMASHGASPQALPHAT